MTYALASLSLVALLIAGGCRRTPTATVIARVGDATLTLDDARPHIDTTKGDHEHQLQEYAAYWVNTELVYQEARRQGIDNADEIRSQMEDIKRQLVNRLYLARQLQSDTASLNESSLIEYYRIHASEFFVREEVMKLNLVVFNDRGSASAFAAGVSRGEDWNAVLQRTLHDTATGAGIVSYAAGHYYTQHTLFPPELWKVAVELATNEITFPVRTSVGYYVLQALAHRKQGSQAEYDLARDEVRQRIIMERQQTRLAELLGTLRKRYSVEIMLGADNRNDTTMTGSHE